MNIVLDFDDFHPKSPENCIDDIDKLVDACNDIKITLFTPFITLSFLKSVLNQVSLSRLDDFIITVLACIVKRFNRLYASYPTDGWRRRDVC